MATKVFTQHRRISSGTPLLAGFTTCVALAMHSASAAELFAVLLTLIAAIYIGFSPLEYRFREVIEVAGATGFVLTALFR
jgi:hypothetical protein